MSKQGHPQDLPSTAGPSAPNYEPHEEPPSYSESVGIDINDTQHLLGEPNHGQAARGQDMKGQPFNQHGSNYVPTATGLYERSQIFAVPVPPNNYPVQQPINEQPIGVLPPVLSTIPVAGPATFVTVSAGCLECFQRREAKRRREMNSQGDCCICCVPGHVHASGGDCSTCNASDGDAGLFVIICMLVCCLGILIGGLCYACCDQEEVERCSTCGSVI